MCCISSRRYFDDEEEDSSNMDLPYIPAENSPTRQQMLAKKEESDSEEDPLEAFMAEVEVSALSMSGAYSCIGPCLRLCTLHPSSINGFHFTKCHSFLELSVDMLHSNTVFKKECLMSFG